MSPHEKLFRDYLSDIENTNMHKNMENIWSKYVKYYQNNPLKVKHLLVYGPKGIGKYTQVLYFLKHFSPSNLLYDKKITIPKQKQHECTIRVSDVHCELDFGVLGCNAKTNWSNLYLHILDIANSSLSKIRFIVCLNIWAIHPELLDVLYCYMRHEHNISLSFILISHSISFLYRNIFDICEYIWLPRPKKCDYMSIVPNIKKINVQNIQNLTKSKGTVHYALDYFKQMCIPIIKIICNPSQKKLFELREYIYNLLIYNMDINECLLYIISELYVSNQLSDKKQQQIGFELEKFYEKYYNNYRSIYHLESICIKLTKIVNEI
jgi:hypothetical protein